jgi:hypothetical protein
MPPLATHTDSLERERERESERDCVTDPTAQGILEHTRTRSLCHCPPFPQYRIEIIKLVPQLKKIDGIPVDVDEREAASAS